MKNNIKIKHKKKIRKTIASVKQEMKQGNDANRQIQLKMKYEYLHFLDTNLNPSFSAAKLNIFSTSVTLEVGMGTTYMNKEN